MLLTENTAKKFKLSKFPVKHALCTKNTNALVYKQQYPVSSIQQSRAGPSLHVSINPAQVSLYPAPSSIYCYCDSWDKLLPSH